jgi:hypothetical protein
MRRSRWITWLLLLAQLAGCGPDPPDADLVPDAPGEHGDSDSPGAPDDSPDAPSDADDALYVLYGKPAPTADDPELFSKRVSIPRARVKQPSVVLAILDTVRADHLSACGYFRPTSRTLEGLVRRGARLTCRAYAPADWTLPSHASYFTGRPPAEHGAGWAAPRPPGADPDAEAVQADGLHIHPLGPELPTLAEQMAARGYQTVLVSANRLLTHGSGLRRGFQRAVSPPDSADPRRPWVVALLARELLLHVDPEKPLFLVLNILDAHDPWVALPRELAWPGRAEAVLPPDRFATHFGAYPDGGLPADAVEALRRQLADLYDHGVYRADAHLGLALALLEDAGWLARGSRVVVTADHGENLAEHGLVRHSLVYEGNARVPLLYWEVGGERPPEFPEPLSAMAAHALALEGGLPRQLPAVQSVSLPSASHFRTPEASAPGLALWEGDEKVMFVAGGWRRFDLRRDPREERPLPVRSDDPRRVALKATRAALEASARRLPQASGRLVEQLRSLGYVR